MAVAQQGRRGELVRHHRQVLWVVDRPLHTRPRHLRRRRWAGAQGRGTLRRRWREGYTYSCAGLHSPLNVAGFRGEPVSSHLVFLHRLDLMLPDCVDPRRQPDGTHSNHFRFQRCQQFPAWQPKARTDGPGAPRGRQGPRGPRATRGPSAAASAAAAPGNCAGGGGRNRGRAGGGIPWGHSRTRGGAILTGEGGGHLPIPGRHLLFADFSRGGGPKEGAPRILRAPPPGPTPFSDADGPGPDRGLVFTGCCWDGRPTPPPQKRSCAASGARVCAQRSDRQTAYGAVSIGRRGGPFGIGKALIAEPPPPHTIIIIIEN